MNHDMPINWHRILHDEVPVECWQDLQSRDSKDSKATHWACAVKRS